MARSNRSEPSQQYSQHSPVSDYNQIMMYLWLSVSHSRFSFQLINLLHSGCTPAELPYCLLFPRCFLRFLLLFLLLAVSLFCGLDSTPPYLMASALHWSHWWAKSAHRVVEIFYPSLSGICTSDGTIHDFAGPYTINIGNQPVKRYVSFIQETHHPVSWGALRLSSSLLYIVYYAMCAIWIFLSHLVFWGFQIEWLLAIQYDSGSLIWAKSTLRHGITQLSRRIRILRKRW